MTINPNTNTNADIANDTTDDAYTPIYSMPPSPTAEPFIPAPTIPTTTDTPRDRAYTLHLQGYRSPAIAAHLHVPERTPARTCPPLPANIPATPATKSATIPATPHMLATVPLPLEGRG